MKTVAQWSHFFQRNLIPLMLFLVEMGMGFLCDIFPRQLLTVLAVMLSRPDIGRFVVRDKHIDVPTE
jgi:hypothetical protein